MKWLKTIIKADGGTVAQLVMSIGVTIATFFVSWMVLEKVPFGKSIISLIIVFVFLSISFSICLYILSFQLPEKELDDDNILKKQWELYEQLYECQKNHQKFYYVFAFISIVFLCTVLIVVISHKTNQLSIIITQYGIYIMSYVLFYSLMVLYSVWNLYNFKIDYFSNDVIQLLWDKIKELEKRLKKEDASHITEEQEKRMLEYYLDEEGRRKLQNMIREYGLGYQPKDFAEKKRIITETIINNEIDIIKQLEERLRKTKHNKKGILKLINEIKIKIHNICDCLSS